MVAIGGTADLEQGTFNKMSTRSMSSPRLILKRAAGRSSGQLSDDYDVLADGIAVGRIMRDATAAETAQWFWSGYHEDRSPTYGYASTRVAAIADFAKSGGGSERRRRSRPPPRLSSRSRTSGWSRSRARRFLVPSWDRI
jgi:hypothetical protein